ncbi:MAG TPA: class I SAM-dependent methyltransferase [Desulfosporosinus sp.]|nr:class I SAM-dependent methyltransferase [Desulfosporosinus sp.]
MDRETELTQKRYNRTSRFYDFMDRMIKQELRQKVLGQATGKVLEVGVGTGKNFPFYTTRCIDVTCIDLSPGMLTKAKARVKDAHVPVRLLEMDAQHMTLPDASFKKVIYLNIL